MQAHNPHSKRHGGLSAGSATDYCASELFLLPQWFQFDLFIFSSSGINLSPLKLTAKQTSFVEFTK
jgi:hypothetical protein